ncbi:uncharacterized protein LOC143236684 [Tachypleus tridentatus]|uniref:uncharacterized protein LOC143236684 n=1 Tax=Tachypleus tridentatus TaxID=6853 RepID=UPI003FD35DE9
MKVKWSRHLDGFPRRDQPSLSIELDRNPQSLGFTITPESGDQNKNKKPKRGGFLQIFKLTEKKQTPSETDSKLKEETYRKSELTKNGHYSDVVISTFPERDLAVTKDESTCGKLATTINSNRVQQKAATLPRGTSPNIISQMKHLDNLKRRSTVSVTSDPGDMIMTVDPDHKKVKYAIGGLVKLKDYFSDSTCDPKNYREFEEETLAKTQSLDMLRKDKDDTRKKTEQSSDSADILVSTCPRVYDSTKQLVPLKLEKPHSWSSTLLNKENCHQRLRNESNKSASSETGSKEKVGVSSLDKEPDRILMPLGKPSALKMNKNTRNTHYVRFADEFLEDSKSCRSSCSVVINDVAINEYNQEPQERERDKNNEEFQTFTNKHENNPSDVTTKGRKVCQCPSMDPYRNSETRRNKNTEEVSYSLLNKPQTNLHFSNLESDKKVQLICPNKYLGKQDTTRLEDDSNIFQENKETSDELLGLDSQTNKHDRHTKPDIVAYSDSDTTTKYGTSPEKLASIISSDFLNTSSSLFHEENGVKQNISSGCYHQDKVLLERKIDESFKPSLISTNLDQHFISTQLAKQFSDVSNVTFSQLEKLMLQWIQQNEKFLLTREKTSVEKGRQTTDHRKNQEYVQEIQRLGALCETRTKELNLLKMQLKHAILGFDSFCVIVKYLTEELANPRIVTELKKTKDDLHKIEIQLRCYETQLEHLKKSNAEEIQELTITLTEAHKEKIEMLVLAHQEELRSLKANHEKEVQDLKSIHVQSMKDTQIRNNSSVDSLREQHNRLIKDLERDFVNQLHQTMEDHKKVQASLKQQLKELRKHCKDLQQEKKQMEGTLQQDTSTKLQWVLAQKSTLQKEVDSLRIVLELKTTEMHQLRKDNLEMKKELEKLPIAEKKIEILRRRNEDLQALIDEKVQVERQLTSESQQLKEEFEKESKMNSRLSMEKEELQWKLKQTMEASVLLSTMTDSSSNVLDKLLQDDSLLRSPVRMSVYLNEHDTSPSNGEKILFLGHSALDD